MKSIYSHFGSRKGTKINTIESYINGLDKYTTKIIVNEFISQKLKIKYHLEEFSNIDDYYHAKLIHSDGEIVENLLVNKRNWKIIALHK